MSEAHSREFPRDQPDLPTFEEIAPDLPDAPPIVCAVEGDGWRAVGHPAIVPSEGSCSVKNAPLPFRVYGDHPPMGEVGEHISRQFDNAVDRVHAMIDGSDEPLLEIIQMDGEEIVPSDVMTVEE